VVRGRELGVPAVGSFVSLSLLLLSLLLVSLMLLRRHRRRRPRHGTRPPMSSQGRALPRRRAAPQRIAQELFRARRGRGGRSLLLLLLHGRGRRGRLLLLLL
jgi:hypothetical protein